MSIHAGVFILFACVHKVVEFKLCLNSNRFVLLGNRIEIERRTQPKTPATGPALHSAGPAPSPHGPAGSSAQPSTSLPLGLPVPSAPPAQLHATEPASQPRAPRPLAQRARPLSPPAAGPRSSDLLSHPARTPVASSHRRLELARQRLPFPLSFLPAAQQRTRYPRRARRDPYPAAPRDPRRSPFNWPPTDPPCSLFYALAPPTNPSRCPPRSERSSGWGLLGALARRIGSRWGPWGAN